MFLSRPVAAWFSFAFALTPALFACGGPKAPCEVALTSGDVAEATGVNVARLQVTVGEDDETGAQHCSVFYVRRRYTDLLAQLDLLTHDDDGVLDQIFVRRAGGDPPARQVAGVGERAWVYQSRRRTEDEQILFSRCSKRADMVSKPFDEIEGCRDIPDAQMTAVVKQSPHVWTVRVDAQLFTDVAFDGMLREVAAHLADD